ncbi:hypothetical protein [Bradyrhizobium sp. CB3481]
MAGDQRFDPRHEGHVVCDGIFHGARPAGELVDIGEGMQLANE